MPRVLLFLLLIVSNVTLGQTNPTDADSLILPALTQHHYLVVSPGYTQSTSSSGIPMGNVGLTLGHRYMTNTRNAFRLLGGIQVPLLYQSREPYVLTGLQIPLETQVQFSRKGIFQLGIQYNRYFYEQAGINPTPWPTQFISGSVGLGGRWNKQGMILLTYDFHRVAKSQGHQLQVRFMF